MLLRRASFSDNSDSERANLPKRLFLWSKISLKLAVVFLLCPDGNITKPDSYFFPPFKVTLIDDGIPSGYFESYYGPP